MFVRHGFRYRKINLNTQARSPLFKAYLLVGEAVNREKKKKIKKICAVVFTFIIFLF